MLLEFFSDLKPLINLILLRWYNEIDEMYGCTRLWLTDQYTCEAFAIEREQTPKKIKIELMLNLNLFQPKNYIWNININLNFFLEFALFLLQKLHVYI